ncbi:MAG: bifunctional diaminohydroxyphosphoribosylaminopyrimidine deaminase/5-amino-6-(5-phosphoribosylamino)uracil reductase RibD, partial [Pseudomonadota bacterium]
MNTYIAHMQYALRLAEAGLGTTYPNPSVGAVIVKAGQVVGTGATAIGGRPHAETIAIEQAGSDAKDATLYVTLEPCSHHGQTPPCVDAIINAGIKKVVLACGDPNPLVAGQGIAALQGAGIEVVQNICEGEAIRINEGFFSLI